MIAPWVALVPAKRFTRAKSRCTGIGAAARHSLARAMLTDVIARLRAVPEVRAVVVVSGDPEVTSLALASGAATARSRRAPDLNGELADALAMVATPLPGTRLAVVMGDLAGAGTEDYASVLARAEPHERALVGDADGVGTTMLTLREPDCFRPFLGPDSLRRFRADGYHELEVAPSSPLRRDIDTVDQLLSLPPDALGPATRGWLAASVTLAG